MKTKQRHTWIISDTHFNHMKMCDYCDRPKDFSRKIVCHWRAMVAPNDLIYHLRGFYLGSRSGFADYVDLLPGVKILIKGNHDREKDDWYLNRGFAAVMNFAAIIARINVKKNKEHFLYIRVLLSHRPMIIPQFKKYKTINIHGHFHNSTHAACSIEPEVVARLTSDHYLFSLEDTNYKPVLLNRAVCDGWVQQFSRRQKTWLKKN